VPVDVETLCRGMLTEGVQAMKKQGAAKKVGAKKTPEELVEDAKEARRLLTQQRHREQLLSLPAMDNFVVENRVLPEDDVRIIARCLTGRDSTDAEGLRCTLSGIHLVNVLLRDAGCQIIAASLRQNVGITHINLGHNSIGDIGCSALFRNCFGRTLQVLKLGGNAMTDRGCTMVTPLLETVSLRELHLHNNVISDEGVRCIARGLGLNNTLRVLNLNGNRIRCEGVVALASVLLLTAGEDDDVLGAIRNMNKTLGKLPDECRKRVYASNNSLVAVHLASNWLR